MLGLFGEQLIGTDHLTGPIAANRDVSARLPRHTLINGKPILQDLGDDAGTQRLEFFFDESFCNPERELREIEAAFKSRLPMRLFFDLVGFELSVYVIERLSIVTKKTDGDGRATRIRLTVELIEHQSSLQGVARAAAGRLRASTNPLLRRG
ncbi:phage tail protein [Epibacterium ulvae]|uniref:phage tail protein n=1 Tax=Epibacterium ulvae TaxID=1156985 RepID=UPI002491149C|nr:phage tail protein [Epibacterium ulvae]